MTVAELRTAWVQSLTDRGGASDEARIELAGMRDEWTVEVRARHLSLFNTMLDTGPTAERHGILDAGPRWALRAGLSLALTGVLGLPVVPFFIERTSTVTDVHVEGTVRDCGVTWTDSGVTYSGYVSCGYPETGTGDPISFVTLPGPFRAEALDDYEPLGLPAFPAIFAGACLAWFGLSAGLRYRLTKPDAMWPRQQPTSPPGLLPLTQRGPDAFVPYLDHLAGQLQWARMPRHHPARSEVPETQELRHALGESLETLKMWGAIALVPLGIAGYLGFWAPAAGLLILVALTWTVHDAWTTARVRRSLWDTPFDDRVWPYRAMPDNGEGWLVVLVTHPDQSSWLVPVAGRPPLTGVCRTRGELKDGGRVHLLIEGEVWRSESEVLNASRFHVLRLLGELEQARVTSPFG